MLLATLLATAAVLRPNPLHTSGNKIVDGNGKEVRIHGLNIPGMEWTAVGDHLLESVGVALDKWHANMVRVPLNQDRWFGKGPDSKDDGTEYRKLVDQAVDLVQAKGKYILLDLHWSDEAEWGKNIGQHAMPDTLSVEFWKSCAARYANRASVCFDLYNEPIDITWDIWRDGGEVSEKFNGQTLTYKAVGFQPLLNIVRSTGAKNLIVVGGPGYTSKVDGFLTHRLSDPTGNGVLYANHFYPGWESVETWEPRIAGIEKQLPLIISEFGASPNSIPLDFPKRRVAQVLQVLKKHDWNWIAWCMHPAATPCVILDWKYTPTSYFGTLVHAALLGKSVEVPVRPQQASDHAVFDGDLQNGFQYWGGAKADFKASPAHSSKNAIRVEIADDKQFQLGTVPFDGVPYESLSFWIHGGEKGGQQLEVAANVMDTEAGKVKLSSIQPGKWSHITVPFADLGIATRDHVKSFVIRSANGPTQEAFLLDNISVIGRK